ncbi:hypothetical protein ACQEVZ_10985 [Dactylosporangium sp. CA-152071]|uniref:hypothetical protein n=1 Tax=Dactylosporangium sp. CA-152071 TaxID=3239933 RepID=UPI003D8BC824
MKRRLVLAVPALLLSAACGLGEALADYPTEPVEVGTADLVGVWAGYESSARYDLRADGTFEATGVPVSQLGTFFEDSGRLGPFHGHGHWRLGTMAQSSPQTSRDAVLDFDELLDADNSRIERRGDVHLNAATPTDAPDHVLILTTTHDWFQRLP